MTTQVRTKKHAVAEAKTRERPAPPCHVCGKAVDDRIDSTCRMCSRPVHISWAQGQPESACSRIVSPDGCCGIAFVCSPCAEAAERGSR